MTRTDSTQTTAVDPTLADAVELARDAAIEAGGDSVGEHQGVAADGAEGELVATHAFAASLPGYTGWYWAVSVARNADTTTVTVDEVVLLPGPDALLAPPWVPWQERLQPGDLSPGDLLPAIENDPRLVPSYVDDADDDDVQTALVGYEFGLGRVRVLSREGRIDAAERWYAGDAGPDTPMARQAPAQCGTCGFLVSLAGSLRGGFGVCTNEITATDGRVVSVEYGCGAHSETVVVAPPMVEIGHTVYDDGDEITMTPRPAAAPERDESDGATEVAVSEHDRVADEPENPASEAGPEPDPVIVAAEPSVERQQDDEGDEK